MHESSYAIMCDFATRVAHDLGGRPCRVLDVGSMNVNGTYRDLFSFPGAEYVGLDIAPGANVDLVVADLYAWREIPDGSFDVVISGQALEHIPFPWLVVAEIGRKLKIGGLACLIAPSGGPQHRYPVDCYRYFPDGMQALADWAGLDVLHVEVLPADTGFTDGSNQWGDCHCVLRKSSASRAAAVVGAVGRPQSSAPGSPTPPPASTAAVRIASWEPASAAAAEAAAVAACRASAAWGVSPAGEAVSSAGRIAAPADRVAMPVATTADRISARADRIAELQAEVDALRAALVSACEWQRSWRKRAFHRWRPPPGFRLPLGPQKKNGEFSGA